jgi:Tfp pilus assembly protein PilV
MMAERRAWGTDREAGVSIVEVLVASMLLAVGVGAVVVSLGAASEVTATGRHHSVAADLATGELEAARAVTYEELGIAVSSPGYLPRFEGRDTVTETVNQISPTGQATVDETTFDLRRHVTWADIDVGGTRITEGYKHVTVIVAWTDGSGDHQLRLDSGIYEVGSGAG